MIYLGLDENNYLEWYIEEEYNKILKDYPQLEKLPDDFDWYHYTAYYFDGETLILDKEKYASILTVPERESQPTELEKLRSDVDYMALLMEVDLYDRIELAKKYYPRLWSKERIETLFEAGKLTKKEAARIFEEANHEQADTMV